MGQEWYYAKAGNPLGPVMLEQLVAMVRASQVSPEDLVWTPGMAEWVQAGSVAELSGAVRPQPAATHAASPVAPQYTGGTYATPSVMPLSYHSPTLPQYAMYAGFWLRFCAAIIDMIVMWVVTYILGMAIGVFLAAAMRSQNTNGSRVQLVGLGFIQVINIAANWIYYSMMESSTTQGTLGKMAVGIRVTDMNGHRVSFGRATGRYFAKIISGIILCIGYMMAGFTEKKQALHDMIAATLVVKKSVV